MENRNNADYPLKILLLTISILPLLYFNQVKNVPLKVFILGTGSWGIGLIFKMIAHQLIVVKLQDHNYPKLFYSAVNGFLSGLFELSAAYFIIILMKDKIAFDFNAVLSFGLAIGSFEAVIVAFNSGNDLLEGTAVEIQSKRVEKYLKSSRGFKYYLLNLILPVYERILADFIHISTRGMVFISIITDQIYPLLISLTVFIIADGLLGFYFYVSEKINSDAGLAELFIYLTILTAVSTLLFILLITPYRDFVL